MNWQYLLFGYCLLATSQLLARDPVRQVKPEGLWRVLHSTDDELNGSTKGNLILIVERQLIYMKVAGNGSPPQIYALILTKPVLLNGNLTADSTRQIAINGTDQHISFRLIFRTDRDIDKNLIIRVQDTDDPIGATEIRAETLTVDDVRSQILELLKDSKLECDEKIKNFLHMEFSR